MKYLHVYVRLIDEYVLSSDHHPALNQSIVQVKMDMMMRMMMMMFRMMIMVVMMMMIMIVMMMIIIMSTCKGDLLAAHFYEGVRKEVRDRVS